jgi:hypothetical protein
MVHELILVEVQQIGLAGAQHPEGEGGQVAVDGQPLPEFVEVGHLLASGPEPACPHLGQLGRREQPVSRHRFAQLLDGRCHGATRSERGDIRLVREEYTRPHCFATLPIRGTLGKVGSETQVAHEYELMIIKTCELALLHNLSKRQDGEDR